MYFLFGWPIFRDEFVSFRDGHWWFGIRNQVTLSNNPFHKGIPGIRTTN